MGLCLNIASFFYYENKITEKEEINLVYQIISMKEESEYKNKYIAKIIDCKELSIKGCKIYVYTDKDIEFSVGDKLKSFGILSKPETSRNYGGFDYRKLLKQKKIFGIFQIENHEKIGEEKNVIFLPEKIRTEISRKIEEIYRSEFNGFVQGILIGKIDNISEKTKEDFKDSNLSHVLAISGMHVSYVILGISFIIDKTIISKKIKYYILIIFIIIYCLLTGNAVSCIRSCIMSLFAIFAKIFYRKNNFFISFFYSLIFIIILNPYNVYNVGMWLSYFGTLGIVVLFPFLDKYYNHKIKPKKINKMFKYIFDNFLITCSAQIFIFPVILYMFNTVSITFFISNILVSFIVGPILVLGYFSIICSFINIHLGRVVAFFEEILISIIYYIAEICANLPFSKIIVITPNFMFVILYYTVLAIVIRIFYTRKFFSLRIVLSKKVFISMCFFVLKKIKYFIKRNFNIILISFICILFFSILKENELKIYFIDVGQGDSTFIQTPKGKNIIIDGGEGNTDKYDYGKNVVLPYLLDRKISKIDYMIISHADSDHIGGLMAIVEGIRVDKILIGIQPESSKQFEELFFIAKQKRIDVIFLEANQKILIEENILIEVLWPNSQMFIEENILNNNSLVFKLIYNDFSILFTGDIEEIAEDIISDVYNKKLKSNILKAAHHGSITSSSYNILQNINPQIVLIGVGKDNKFGHPSEEVIDRFNDMGSRVYRTDIHGEINLRINKNGKIKINTKNK